MENHHVQHTKLAWVQDEAAVIALTILNQAEINEHDAATNTGNRKL